MAIVMDNSIVMRREIRFSNASLKIGQPPISRPTTPMTLTLLTGSQIRNHTAALAMATNAMRAISVHSKPWSCPSVCVVVRLPIER